MTISLPGDHLYRSEFDNKNNMGKQGLQYHNSGILVRFPFKNNSGSLVTNYHPGTILPEF